MDKDTALRLALEALKKSVKFVSGSHDPVGSELDDINEAITAIEAALEAKDEPVAWMYPDDLKRFETSEAYAEAYSIEMVSPTKGETVPLYTTPPQRTWVGLTDEEIEDIPLRQPNGYAGYARAIEAKLKEKNT
jgi:hypothetical protein